MLSLLIPLSVGLQEHCRDDWCDEREVCVGYPDPDSIHGGLTDRVRSENRYYKLKKLYFDNVGGADMLKLASGDGAPKKTKATPSKAANNGGGKKRRKQEEGGEDDEEIAESTPTKKLKEEEQVAGEEKADSKTGGSERDDYA